MSPLWETTSVDWPLFKCVLGPAMLVSRTREVLQFLQYFTCETIMYQTLSFSWQFGYELDFLRLLEAIRRNFICTVSKEGRKENALSRGGPAWRLLKLVEKDICCHQKLRISHFSLSRNVFLAFDLMQFFPDWFDNHSGAFSPRFQT